MQPGGNDHPALPPFWRENIEALLDSYDLLYLDVYVNTICVTIASLSRAPTYDKAWQRLVRRRRVAAEPKSIGQHWRDTFDRVWLRLCTIEHVPETGIDRTLSVTWNDTWAMTASLLRTCTHGWTIGAVLEELIARLRRGQKLTNTDLYLLCERRFGVPDYFQEEAFCRIWYLLCYMVDVMTDHVSAQAIDVMVAYLKGIEEMPRPRGDSVIINCEHVLATNN